MNKHISDRPRRHVVRKGVKVIEIVGAGTYELQPDERVIDARTVHEVVEVVRPVKVQNPFTWGSKRIMPKTKTIITIECVEFEYE